MNTPRFLPFGISFLAAWAGLLLSGSAAVANTAPVARGIARVTVNEDAAVSTVNLNAAFDDAEDADSKLKFVVTANTNAALVSTQITTGQLKLTFKANQYGAAQLTVRCTDTGGLSAQTSFQVVVRSVNDAPTLNAIAVQQAKVGMVFRLQLSGRDPDLPNDTLQFDLDAASLSRGMIIDSSTGLISWLPPTAAAGQTFSCTAFVQDAQPLSSSRTFTIQVASPAVTTAPPLLAVNDRTAIAIGQTVDLAALIAANDVTNGRPVRIVQVRFPFFVNAAESLQYSVTGQGITSLRYNNRGYSGTQVMNYTIADDLGRTDSGWLTIQAGNFIPPSQPPTPSPAVLTLNVFPATPPGAVIGTATVVDPDGGTAFFREADSNLFPELKSNGGDAILATAQANGLVLQPGEGLAPFSIDPSTGAIRYVGGMALISGQVYVRNYLVFDGRTGTPGGSNFNPNFGKLVVIVQ